MQFPDIDISTLTSQEKILAELGTSFEKLVKIEGHPSLSDEIMQGFQGMPFQYHCRRQLMTLARIVRCLLKIAAID